MNASHDRTGTGPRLRADAQRNRARILDAAEAIFAEQGASASTEKIAARAGVAIGTIFRHFPTKQDLLAAIMKTLLERLTRQATDLAARGDHGEALFTFFADTVTQAAHRKAVVNLLADNGITIDIAESIQALHTQIADLLTNAQRAGAIRPDAQPDEVIALLTSTCHAALHPNWTPDLQHRTLTIIFDGLRHTEHRPG